jgi:hypothetical protein
MDLKFENVKPNSGAIAHADREFFGRGEAFATAWLPRIS